MRGAGIAKCELQIALACVMALSGQWPASRDTVLVRRHQVLGRHGHESGGDGDRLDAILRTSRRRWCGVFDGMARRTAATCSRRSLPPIRGCSPSWAARRRIRAVYGLGYDANNNGQFGIDDDTQFDSLGFAFTRSGRCGRRDRLGRLLRRRLVYAASGTTALRRATRTAAEAGRTSSSGMASRLLTDGAGTVGRFRHRSTSLVCRESRWRRSRLSRRAISTTMATSTRPTTACGGQSSARRRAVRRQSRRHCRRCGRLRDLARWQSDRRQFPARLLGHVPEPSTFAGSFCGLCGNICSLKTKGKDLMKQSIYRFELALRDVAAILCLSAPSRSHGSVRGGSYFLQSGRNAGTGGFTTRLGRAGRTGAVHGRRRRFPSRGFAIQSAVSVE